MLQMINMNERFIIPFIFLSRLPSLGNNGIVVFIIRKKAIF